MRTHPSHHPERSHDGKDAVHRTHSAPFKTGRESRVKESHRKDPASHPDPESCVGGREAAGEALTGAHAGQPSSCEIRYFGVPPPLCEAEGHTEDGATGKAVRGPRAVGDPEHAWKFSARETGDPTGTRHRWWGGSDREVVDPTPGVHVRGKSDDRVVPEKPLNNDRDDLPAEMVEGRRSTEGNTLPETASRTQSRLDASIALQRLGGSPAQIGRRVGTANQRRSRS